MNDIVKPLTADGLVGWDAFGQFWIWRLRGDGRREGSIYCDVREKVCCVCRRGWEATADSLRDQYFWSRRAEWAHQSCLIRFEALQEYEFWCNALVDAGFIFGSVDNPKMIGEGASLESLPNGYWPKGDPWSEQPWYRVRLLKKLDDDYTNAPHGRTLLLGSRKRVYHLEIESGTGSYDMAKAAALFASEDVTKEIRADRLMIHAWGRDKAREYLKHFATVLDANWREKFQKKALAQ